MVTDDGDIEEFVDIPCDESSNIVYTNENATRVVVLQNLLFF